MREQKSDITCIYCGPLGIKGAPAAGGFVAANRKNIDELTANGVEVVENPYPDSSLSKFSKLAVFLKLPFNLVKYRGKRCIVHITTLYRMFIYFEAMVVAVAKLLGFKVVFDVRGGSFVHYYRKRSSFYRRVVKWVLSKADIVTVESTYYIDHVRDIAGADKRVVYFPNVAVCTNLVPIHKPDGVFNIIYFGAINRTKGCDLDLEVINILDDRFRLFLAGKISDGDMHSAIINNPKTEYLGMLTSAQLNERLKDMHFFIFPSKHTGEGQSNSLIESMFMGVVPVASAQGFSAEVIGSCGTVLPVDATPDMYAQAILKIADSGDYPSYSAACRQHIVEAHNVVTEIAMLIDLYRSLL